MGGTNTPAFMAFTNATGQSISSGSATELTMFTDELFDSDSGFNTSTGRFTAGTAGKYFVTASIYFSALTSGQNIFEIRVNGDSSTVKKQIAYMQYSESAAYQLTGILELDADDYISCFILQQAGTTKTAGAGGFIGGSFFGAFKLIGV